MEPESFSRNKKVALNIGIIVVILFGLNYFFTHRAAGPTQIVDTATTSSTASFDVSPNNQKPAAGKIVQIPIIDTKITAPDISMTPRFASSVTTDMRNEVNTKLVAARDALQEFPSDFNAWIGVATLYRNAGDYAMAAKILNYISQKWPNNPISYNNLGDLYMNYLKDYPKAEAAYKSQIRIRADDLNAYRALFELYTEREYRPSSTAAEDILKKGVAMNPAAYDLEVILARYYKAAGRTVDAKAQYDAAIAAAKKAGKNDVADQIQTELSSL